MTDEIPETAPTLGEGTDIAGNDPDAGEPPEHTQTMQTPDELGGTGGEQAGGAG